jgi:hypothetical protein
VFWIFFVCQNRWIEAGYLVNNSHLHIRKELKSLWNLLEKDTPKAPKYVEFESLFINVINIWQKLEVNKKYWKFIFFSTALASIITCQKLFFLSLSSIYEQPNFFSRPKNCLCTWTLKNTIELLLHLCLLFEKSFKKCKHRNWTCDLSLQAK